MIKTITKKDLIRYLYRETTEEEENEIRLVLDVNPGLMQVYREMNHLREELDHCQMEPSAETVAGILRHIRTVPEKQ